VKAEERLDIARAQVLLEQVTDFFRGFLLASPSLGKHRDEDLHFKASEKCPSQCVA